MSSTLDSLEVSNIMGVRLMVNKFAISLTESNGSSSNGRTRPSGGRYWGSNP